MDLHFLQQFKESIDNGTKIQTIRMTNRRISEGSIVNLVINPYNSRREILKAVMILQVIPIEIDAEKRKIKIRDKYLNRDGARLFAKNEGFQSADDMWHYINSHRMHGSAILLMWSFFCYAPYYLPTIISYTDLNQNK